MRGWLPILLLAGLVGCVGLQTRPQLYQGEALTFFEQTRTSEPQQLVRYLVTPEWLRVEIGGQRDYLLFDRRRQQLFRVLPESKSIEVFAKGTKEIAADRLDWQQQQEQSLALPRSGAPNSDQQQAVHYRFTLAQQPCLELVAVASMLPAATTALGEYRSYLAQYRDGPQPALSAQQQTCYRALFVQQPQRAFSQGFPLREWSVTGHQRFLQDAKEHVKFESQLFDLPEDYVRSQATSVTF